MKKKRTIVLRLTSLLEQIYAVIYLRGWLRSTMNLAVQLFRIVALGLDVSLGIPRLQLELAVLKRRLASRRNSRKLPPSLNHISNFADFWGLGLRKRIKATAGDFDVEVRRLHKEKRYRMAKWNVVLAWGYAIWYVLRGPYDMLKGALVKALKGL
jgi:hypothetical protein